MRQKYDAWLSQQAPEEMFFFLKSIIVSFFGIRIDITI